MPIIQASIAVIFVRSKNKNGLGGCTGFFVEKIVTPKKYSNFYSSFSFSF
jgi:hypothetical protein